MSLTAVKERPILFSGVMVRPMLADLKHQTRRTRGLDEVNESPARWNDVRCYDGEWWFRSMGTGPNMLAECAVTCPYGLPGERLWVRETIYCDQFPYSEGARLPKQRPAWADLGLYFRADGECCEQIPECACAEVGKPRWRPSIHMPRWASRISLELTDVRVQRLQDISEQDALAEGIRWTADGPLHAHIWMSHVGCECNFPTARDAYAALWDDINGAGSWDANPWVWSLTFKRIGA